VKGKNQEDELAQFLPIELVKNWEFVAEHATLQRKTRQKVLFLNGGEKGKKYFVKDYFNAATSLDE